MNIACWSAVALLAGCSLPANLRDAMVDTGAQQPEDTGVPEDAQAMDDGAIADSGVSQDADAGGDADVVTDTGVPVMCTAATVPTVITPLSAAAYATQFVTFSARAPDGATVEFEYSNVSSFAMVVTSSAVVDATGVARVTIPFADASRNTVRWMRARVVCAGGVRGTTPSVARWFRVGTRPMSAAWTRAIVERIEYDSDNDGRTDLAASLGQLRPGTGSVRVLRTGGAVSDNIDGSSASFGRAIVGVGDTNGDGFGDLLVSEPDLVQTGSVGRVSLYRGTFGAPSPTATVVLNGYRGLSSIGLQLAALGDINADGLADFAVSATEGGMTRLFVFASPHSTTSAPVQTLAIVGLTSPTALVAGDLTGDGISELVVGFGAANDSVGDVFSFRSTGMNAAPYEAMPLRVASTYTKAGFGQALAVGAFVDDGALDLCVTAPGRGSPSVINPSLFVFRNPYVENAAISLLPQIGTGFTPSDAIGKQVVTLGDRDGDGRSEFVLMHPGRENGSTQGALWLIEMQSVTALDEQLAAIGTWTGESFTRGLAATGGFLDATGSGRLSFAVTRDLSATMRDIAVYSYSPLVGSPMWMIGSPTMIVASGTTGDRLAARHLRGRSTACERAVR